ncbi:hypothetical protein JVU11DRAFT_993 [Chiua virens]|nr:hypothetical protein JVU11DRAFT_993 [Chiua virens]
MHYTFLGSHGLQVLNFDFVLRVLALHLQEEQAHLRVLTRLSLLIRLLAATLIITSTYLLTLFDSSPQLLLSETIPPWISSLLRWDAFHFVHVAQQGRAYEHAWAFFPALPFIMRVSGHLLSCVPGLAPDAAAQLLGGAVLAAIFDPTRVLYRLSLYHLRSPSAAFLATALSLLSSSPAPLRFAPYTEPFFTYCSYQGMWACARSQWFVASVWFALASAFRSNGIFLSGFLLWGMLVAPSRRLGCCIAWSSLQFPSSHSFITIMQATFSIARLPRHPGNASGRPEWCDQGLFPSIYTHVQRQYWDVGFLRYWTLSNIPNFILALPVFLNVYAFCAFYLARLPRIYPRLSVWPPSWGVMDRKAASRATPGPASHNTRLSVALLGAVSPPTRPLCARA